MVRRNVSETKCLQMSHAAEMRAELVVQLWLVDLYHNVRHSAYVGTIALPSMRDALAGSARIKSDD